MPECPVEPSVPHRIRLNVRISPKYSEYQIFGQKCAEYQILGKTSYLLNFPAHTKIYLSSQRKQIQGSLDSCRSYNFPTVSYKSVFTDGFLSLSLGCYGISAITHWATLDAIEHVN